MDRPPRFAWLLVPLAAVALLTACGNGDAGEVGGDRSLVLEGEEGEAVLRVEGEDFSIEGPERRTSFMAGDTPGEGFPPELIYPRGVLTQSATVEEDARPQFLVFWETEDGAGMVLDFYEAAFDALGIPGERVRTEATGFATLDVGTAGSGATVVIVEGSGQNGRNVVAVGYLLE